MVIPAAAANDVNQRCNYRSSPEPRISVTHAFACSIFHFANDITSPNVPFSQVSWQCPPSSKCPQCGLRLCASFFVALGPSLSKPTCSISLVFLSAIAISAATSPKALLCTRNANSEGRAAIGCNASAMAKTIKCNITIASYYQNAPTGWLSRICPVFTASFRRATKVSCKPLHQLSTQHRMHFYLHSVPQLLGCNALRDELLQAGTQCICNRIPSCPQTNNQKAARTLPTY